MPYLLSMRRDSGRSDVWPSLRTAFAMHGRFVVLLRGMPVLMQPLVDGAWHADDPTAGTSTRQIHACDDLLEVLCTYTAGPVCTQVRWTVSFYGLLAGLPLLRNASCVCLSAILARHGRAQAHAPRRQPRSTSAGTHPRSAGPAPYSSAVMPRSGDSAGSRRMSSTSRRWL